jgi:hypothetical protein
LQRAQRYTVNWPVRVRRINGTRWHLGRSVNLSVTGILLQLPRGYSVGQRVEVEIDFLAHPDQKSIIRGLGRVVRALDRAAAIHFDVDGDSSPVQQLTIEDASRPHPERDPIDTPSNQPAVIH